MEDFEWDENKREINLKKHGIDFAGASKIFYDSFRIERTKISNGEIRQEIIGIAGEIILFVVSTYRSKKRRIISARRANRNERKEYISSKQAD